MVIRRIEFDVYGAIKKTRRNIKSFRVGMQGSNKKSMLQLAEFVQQRAKFYAPKGVTRPGLKESIFVESGATDNEKFVVAFGREARPMEYGFRTHFAPMTPDMAAWISARLGYAPTSPYFKVGGGNSQAARGYKYMYNALSEASEDKNMKRMFGNKVQTALQKTFR